MSQKARHIISASWTSPQTGIVSLRKDWLSKKLPPLYWGDGSTSLSKLKLASPLVYADLSGYYSEEGMIVFCMREDRYSNIGLAGKELYVAGTFNDWNPRIGHALWRMRKTVLAGQNYLTLRIEKNRLSRRSKVAFKFITGNGDWLEVSAGAPNCITDSNGNRNYAYDKNVTGQHIFTFTTPQPIDNGGQGIIRWVDGLSDEEALMLPGEYIHAIYTHLQPGVHRSLDGYTFRLFAPRASAVKLRIFRKIDESDTKIVDLERADAAMWEVTLKGEWANAFYFYHVHGAALDPQSAFDPNMRIVDPYAYAMVSAMGPGIVVDETMLIGPEKFQPPCWHDLIVMETHVRDLLQHAPLKLTEKERMGFSGLSKWIRHPEFYPAKMGVNAVELQPIQQFDTPTKDVYGWGYMPVNWFSPSSHYAEDPEKASQIAEFQDVVKAFHERGMAVILDVVYNHYGEPNYLQFIDKRYYFELSPDGHYMNWSGCGNTLYSSAPMAQRLIADSLLWLMKTYGVDGFRFDLAELIGKDTLSFIERELKAVNPAVILIAEPWSFRGHIAYNLRSTGYASWNDGYREFIRKYVKGEGNAEGILYFLTGSLDHLSAWPAQSVNYVESHDDSCWMDSITENPERDGRNPTFLDRRRTHLMMATLMMSIGIPMIAEGQDMLRSKQGNSNTYLRGDLNALNYKRQQRYPATHDYFRAWIAFRQSELGALLRLGDKPNAGYFTRISNSENSSIGLVYNADETRGGLKLLYCINPHSFTSHLKIDAVQCRQMVQIADHERLAPGGLSTATLERHGDMLELPPYSCALWILS